MAKKRRKLDEFLYSRRKSQEAILDERSQLSNRLFRRLVGAVVVLVLLWLVGPGSPAVWVGLGILYGLCVSLGAMTLHRLAPDSLRGAASFNELVLLTVVIVLTFKLLLELEWSPYLAPLPFFAMVTAIAYTPSAAILLVTALAAYLAQILPKPSPPDVDVTLAVVLTLGGITSVLGVGRVRRQSRPAIAGIYCGLVQAIAILGFELLDSEQWAATMKNPDVFREAGRGFLGGILWGGVLTSVLPVVERFFDVVTERRLLELGDPSNKLLQVLRERAPGTYMHTLGVQQLARNAAEAIGADALLTEVGAFYHDIGKILKPEYFVENMGEDRSIHDRLRPSMSKMIIISHVKDGISLAEEEKLPQAIIDMIPMHHGTTVVEFFYRKARQESRDEDEAPGEDVSYRYPGPKPRFAEAGILMLADATEAIAKTIKEPSSNRFRDMVRGIVFKRLEDGQLDECNLTIADLKRIEDSFVRTLTGMYHGRIDYGADD